MNAKSITSGDLEPPSLKASRASTSNRLSTLLSTALSLLSRLLLSDREPHIWFKRDRSTVTMTLLQAIAQPARSLTHLVKERVK